MIFEGLSDKLQEYIPESEYENLAKDIYESTQGKHFDEEFAKEIGLDPSALVELD